MILTLMFPVCACRAEQLYQKVMSLWHQLHINMKSVVSWHYLLKDIRSVSGWNLDTVRNLFLFFFLFRCFVSSSALSYLPSPSVRSAVRFVVSLRRSGSRSWITWSPSWPTSCPTAKRALCSRRAKDESWRRTFSRPSSTARTCCLTWRLVRQDDSNTL